MSELIQNESVIYTTGLTSDGKQLIGGVWTLRDQEGFPLEMSYLIAQDRGWQIDWAEAMADASLSDRCPSLMQQIEAFLPESVILHLKLGFVFNVRSGKSFMDIMNEKRANAKKFDEFIQKAIVQMSEKESKQNE